MRDSFFLAFLSQNTPEELCVLFKEQQPDYKTLHELIEKLGKYQSALHLQSLLALIEEWDPSILENRALIQHAHQQLLSIALQTADLQAITHQLACMQDWLDDNPQTDLSEWLLWIKQAKEAKELLPVFEAMPMDLRKKLYQCLLASLEGHPLWLDALINFIIEQPEPVFEKKQSQHLQELARSLLLAPLDCDPSQITLLSLRLDAQTLANTTFQLRAIASTCSDHHLQLRQCYLKQYETLITALTVRATTSSEDYEALAKNNAELANLLMAKRLKTLEDVGDQRLLVRELLEHCEQFDWQDVQFNTLAMDKMIRVFLSLCKEELQTNFKLYYQFHSRNNPYNIIHFLDKLFEKHRDPALVLDCLDACDNEDKTLTINFITNTQSHDNHLLEQCLSKLHTGQLIRLCGHVLALKQILKQQDQPPIIDVYIKVLCHQLCLEPIKSWDELAQQLTLLPSNTQDEPICALFNQLQGNIALQYQYIKALLESDCDKSRLLSLCRQLIPQISLKEQVELLEEFNSEKLFELFLFMVKHKAADEEFNGFVELFKDISREPLLHYILSNTPLISHNFLNKLMPTIDSRNLITLIEQLILHVQKEPDYLPTLEQLLLHFCQRLQITFNENDPIHLWTLCEYRHLFAYHLLASPSCLASLSSRSSMLQNYTPHLLQGVVVTSSGNDLRLRALRVLEEVVLDDEAKTQDIVLSLLNHFCQQPSKLQGLFSNLEAALPCMNEASKLNYEHIKKACWFFLKNKDEQRYDAKSAAILLTTQLTSPHRFDGVLAHLASQLSSTDNAHIGAQYITQIESNNLAALEAHTLVTILCKSMDEKTVGNWKKMAEFLASLEAEQVLGYIKHFIHQVKDCENNPLLVEQVLQFIQDLPSFETLLPLLGDEELQWLVKQSEDAFLYEHFPHWLAILLAHNRFEQVDGGALLALLPPKQTFLDNLFEHPALEPWLHSIFVSFSKQEQTNVHFIALFQQINQQDQEQKRAFLNFAHQHLIPESMLSIAAPVLNLVLLNLPNMQITLPEDRKLVLNQLKLFAQWAANPAEEKLNRSYFINELQQLIFNTLISFSEKDTRWAGLILSSDAFASLALTWLPDVDVRSSEKHPFTKILLKNATVKFHPILADSAVYQDYIKQLLTYPPASLNDDHFALLFDSLHPQEQQNLALNLLQKPTLDDVQWSSLLTLSAVLSVEALFDLYEKSTTRFVFVDLITRHAQGIKELKSQQRKALLESLETGKQLLRILDSQTPKASKFALINAIFQYLQEKQMPLSIWLENVHADGQTIAAFANYTEEDQHQAQLLDVIQKSTWHAQSIQQFLHHPPVDFHFEHHGLLARFVKNAWFHPEQGWQCHPSLFAILDPSKIVKTLKKQWAFLNEVARLDAFYQPLCGCNEAATEMLTAARWLQRLPLLCDGLLELIHGYKTTENTLLKRTIEKTPLFQTLMAPLLEGRNSEALFAIQLNELFDLLLDYEQTLANSGLSQELSIKGAIQTFKFKLQALEHYSPLPLRHLFHTHSHFAQIKKGNIIPLPTLEIENLSTALEQHRHFIAEKIVSPQKTYHALMEEAASNQALLESLPLHDFLLSEGLFSPIGQDIHGSLLNQLLYHCPPDYFTNAMSAMDLKIKQYKRCFYQLNELRVLNKTDDVLKHLISLDHEFLVQALETCESCQLPNLANLILMSLHLKRINLPRSSLAHLLPGNLTRNLEVDWVWADLKKMDEIERGRLERQREIEIVGLKYHPNKDNNKPRLASFFKSRLYQTDIKALSLCLNSYLPLFLHTEDKETKVCFLQTLNNLLEQIKKPQMLMSNLREELITAVIDFALQDPVIYENLLQKFIMGSFKDNCARLIKMRLAHVLSECMEHPPQTMLDLSIHAFGAIPSKQMNTLFWLQRLLFQTQPFPTLKDWPKNTEQGFELASHYFRADASLLALLMQLNQEAEEQTQSIPPETADNLRMGFQFLRQESKALSYWSLMEDFTQTNLQGFSLSHPAACFSSLCLLSFLTNNNQLLVDGFILWLDSIDNKSLEKQLELSDLLKLLEAKNLIPSLCESLKQHDPLPDLKSDWLFSQMTQTKPLDPDLIDHLTKAFPWRWLDTQIRATTINSLTILHAALQQEQHLSFLCANEENQSDFLSLLSDCHLSVNGLILLQKKVPSASIRSLIALHLLSREDYLQKIPGESLLNELKQLPSGRLKRRLQALVQQVDFNQLTPSRIKTLPPEAAANLLLAPQFFHHLNEKRLPLLLETLGSQRDIFIQYWLSYYALLPNSEKPFIVLVNKYYKTVFKTLQAMDIWQRQPLLMMLIEHYKMLGTEKASQLNELLVYADESHLNFAIKRYLHASEPDEMLVQMIKNLLDQILPRQQLSAQTLQLFIRLMDQQPFEKDYPRLVKATGDYLRQSAYLSDCSIFYDDGQLAMGRLQKPIILNDDASKQEEGGSFLANLLTPWRLFTDNAKEDVQLAPLPPSPLLESLAKQVEKLLSIDYFLIYYKGETATLDNFLNDYLGYCSENNIALLHTTAWLMTFEELSQPIRQVLFDVFSKHPNLIDDKIASYLLRYHPQHFIRQLASRHHYPTFINLCQTTLPHLESFPEIAELVLQAIKEADFEETLSHIGSFLHDWRIWFKRCVFYGWTGFFEPNKPLYVPPFETHDLNLSYQKSLQRTEQIISTLQSKQTLESVLDEIATDPSIKNLTALYDALNLYELAEDDPRALFQRVAIDHLFNTLLEEAIISENLDQWLTNHYASFLLNRKKLIALHCQQDNQEALKNLLEKAGKGPGSFKEMVQEFFTDSEPLLIPEEEKPEPQSFKPFLFTSMIKNFNPFLLWGNNANPNKKDTPEKVRTESCFNK